MKNTERNDVEIDYCTQCRGVWLDRGELEKIIATVESQPYKRTNHDHNDHSDHDDHDRYERRSESRVRDGEYRREGDYGSGRRKREGFLGNLFDMFGD
jgi:Zn-finger nucleic acid-binding protein